MKKGLIFFVMSVWHLCAWGQTVTLSPTITPSLFQTNTPITVEYDVTGTSLASLTNAYAWVWIPGSSIDAKYNVNPASSNSTLTDHAKFTKSVVSGKTLFTLNFTPADFFAEDISSKTQMGILLKGNDWSNGQTTDYLANFGFKISLVSPTSPFVFVDTNDAIAIQATTIVPADFELLVNNVLVNTQVSTTSYNYSHTVIETSGHVIVTLKASAASGNDEVSFEYVISGGSPMAPRPTGIISGINYDPADHTKVTLCLLAPGKSSVYALGDFMANDTDDWLVFPENIMKRDGEYFWIELTGLTPGAEYAFQYLVDESVFIADPYADKVLDPDDQYIPSATYPGLKTFPIKAKHSEWYFNRASVFQTNQPAYDWQVNNFDKPAKKNLVVYELLLRDFFANGERNYQNLIDTISYFKRLGINAIELMPIMEFNGNESWGYNPTFMFAPDKYYGTRDKFREFVDVCHQNGIAVILDIALNHQDIPNPYVLMDYNFNTGKPNPTNKWFNTDARHPYSVFFDMNHESSYTQAYVDTIAYHWLNEYKVDGFRFDLSKGFTQNDRCGSSTSNEGCFAQRDDSRIAILKRMADAIWLHTPNAIVILEHFADNSEEKELAEYRAGEGKGMMLWGNLNYAYNQNTKGFSAGSDFSWISHANRGWSVPHVVGYMESHDEERLMYRNLQEGNSSIAYNVRSLNTALSRIKSAATIFCTIPGPKMIWQFGELGYDYSINTCSDGSISSDCRLSARPVKWEYQQDPNRRAIYDHMADLMRMRRTYSVFTDGTATFSGMSSLFKQLTLKNNPYTEAPADAGQMNAVVAVNFEVTSNFYSVSFPHSGVWYDYYDEGNPVTVTALTKSIVLEPGQYKLFTDVFLPESSTVTATETELTISVKIYPNPTTSKFTIDLSRTKIKDLKIFDTRGVEQRYTLQESTVDISNLPVGMYILKISDVQNRRSVQKIIKK